jgi:TPR repeat protein
MKAERGVTSHYRTPLITGLCFVACVGLAGCSSATNTIGVTFGWVYNILLPVSEFAFLIVLFVLCPMALFKRTRHTAAKWILLSSYLFGLTTWCLGGLLTFASWGLVGLIIGLVLFGLGVVPMGILGAFVVLQDPTAGLTLIGMTVLIFATRFGGLFLRTHDFGDQQRQPTENNVIANLLARAGAGHAETQYDLGVMYTFGSGVPKDLAEAVRWYRLAAEQGFAEAQYKLGVMYTFGKGVPKDSAEAARWCCLAAEQGFAGAQYKLGVMYGNGRGVPKDSAEAARWCRLAAEQGFAEAQYKLGVMHGTGTGVPEDYAEAARWYRLAAEQGFTEAQYKLGVMYSDGTGVPRNLERAYVWFSVAISSYGEGKKHPLRIRNSRDQASRDFTPEQLSRAQALATTCFTSNFTDCGEP